MSTPDITNPAAHGSQAASPAVPPQFAPLFALISTSAASPSGGSSPTHHHPTVQYIFADDHDSDLLITAAALQTLDSAPALPSSNRPARPRMVGDGDEGGRAAARAPAERFLIVDLDPSATRVVAARSMARDWQIVHADLTPAPTWDGDESTSGTAGDGGGGRGLMLRIEGVRSSALERDEPRDAERDEGLEKLAERYERRLGELRRVVDGVGAGEGEMAGGGGRGG